MMIGFNHHVFPPVLVRGSVLLQKRIFVLCFCKNVSPPQLVSDPGSPITDKFRICFGSVNLVCDRVHFFLRNEHKMCIFNPIELRLSQWFFKKRHNESWRTLKNFLEPMSLRNIHKQNRGNAQKMRCLSLKKTLESLQKKWNQCAWGGETKKLFVVVNNKPRFVNYQREKRTGLVCLSGSPV